MHVDPEAVKDPVGRFRRELEALEGVFTECQPGDLGEKIWSVLQEHHVERLITWEESHLPVGLLDFLRDKGIQCIQEPDASVAAGLTGALAGVAESATLVLPGGAGRPLTASLLPSLHIAVIQAKDIYPDMTPVLKLPELRQASASALISGPSRTADIEMALTLGVHGPKEVYVFCVNGTNP